MLEGATLTASAPAIHPELPGATVTITNAPRHGNASVDSSLQLRYTPDAGYNGVDTVGFRLAAGATTINDTLTITVYQASAANAPAMQLPETGLSARDVAVLVNDNDPQSVAVAAYYVQKRHIPAANVIHLQFTAGGDDMTSAAFAPLKAAADAAAGSAIQAYVISWTYPYRVDSMSMTSAFALGFNTAYENFSSGCAPTRASIYYQSNSTRPFSDLGVRPTMMLAGNSTANVMALIDKGVAADFTFPGGTGYLLRTSDSARSVRWSSMVSTYANWNHLPDGLALNFIDNSGGLASDSISNKTDVLFYLTGLVVVPNITTNQYLPGAVADHLTSVGGVLDSTGQMSVLRWLEAGATGSYGTVVEPCNYTAKFPDPATLLDQYYRGGTLLEAYWKSVNWPGEGVFVGEPLARPFGRAFLTYDTSRTLTLRTTALIPGQLYDLQAADSPGGTYSTVVSGITVSWHRMMTITLPNANRAAYRLVPHS